MMKIHELVRVLWSNIFACRACSFRAVGEEAAIEHAVQNQFVVRS